MLITPPMSGHIDKAIPTLSAGRVRPPRLDDKEKLKILVWPCQPKEARPGGGLLSAYPGWAHPGSDEDPGTSQSKESN